MDRYLSKCEQAGLISSVEMRFYKAAKAEFRTGNSVAAAKSILNRIEKLAVE
jgi:hypothetical protein